MPQLEDVLAQALLAFEQVEQVCAGHLGAAAIAAQDHLVADVYGREAGRGGVDVQHVADLIARQRRNLGLASGQRCGLLDVGP